MRIPKGMSEEEVLKIINGVIKKLAPKFRFGSFEVSDIAQEAMIEAIKGLEKYDENQPLVNFMYVHIKNRLINFKRNNYTRIEEPCIKCPIRAFLPPDKCSEYKDRMDCAMYESWIKRNNIKRNLTHTLEYSQVVQQHGTPEKGMEYGDEVIESINSREILEIIDRDLPISMRKTYLQMLSGDKVPKKERILVEQEIIKILKKNNYEL